MDGHDLTILCLKGIYLLSINIRHEGDSFQFLVWKNNQIECSSVNERISGRITSSQHSEGFTVVVTLIWFCDSESQCLM
jgi:hypothetical protein